MRFKNSITPEERVKLHKLMVASRCGRQLSAEEHSFCFRMWEADALAYRAIHAEAVAEANKTVNPLAGGE